MTYVFNCLMLIILLSVGVYIIHYLHSTDFQKFHVQFMEETVIIRKFSSIAICLIGVYITVLNAIKLMVLW